MKGIAALVLISACSSKSPASFVPTLPSASTDRAAQALDNLKWYVDAYGAAGMSSPLLVQPDDTFKFSLATTADTFFANEKDQISGRGAVLSASAASSGASLSAAVDVSAIQQYAAALDQYRRSQSAIDQKQAILNAAAYRVYAASMSAAQQIKDPQQRANAEADAAKQLVASLSGPSSADSATFPTPPAPPSLPTATVPSNGAAGLVPSLAAAQTLYASGTPGVSGETRNALLMAAGDTATAAMLGLLLDPSKVSKFSGKRVVFGVSMIAVDPGWKTRAGYSVDIQANLDYEWVWARPMVRDAFLSQKADSPVEQEALAQLQRCVVDSLPLPHPDTDLNGCGKACAPPSPFDSTASAPYVFQGALNVKPVVAAASPMGDGQALDLQASSRQARQQAYEMALALSAVGLAAQASAFKDFAKSLQDDLETRTNNIVVSAYSSTGGFFGFKVNPRLQASPKAPSTVQVLQVPTFPVLLVIGADDNELHARVVVMNGRCFVAEPRMTLFTGTRWTRMDEPCKSESPASTRCEGLELTELERTRATIAANDAVVAFGQRCSELKNDDDRNECFARHEYLVHEAAILGSALVGTNQALWLPPELVNPSAPKTPKPSVSAAAPASVDLVYTDSGLIQPQTVRMIVTGKDLDQVDVTKVSSPAVAVTAKLVDDAIELDFTVALAGVYTFALPIKNSPQGLVTPPLHVNAPKTVNAISRTTGKEKDGTTKDTLTFTPGTPADVVKSEIEKNKSPADIKVNVEAETRTGAQVHK